MKKLIAILIFLTVCMHGCTILYANKKGQQELLILPTFSYFSDANQLSMGANIEEIWKDVVGYEGLYQISNLGRVKRIVSVRCRVERYLCLETDKDGYLICSLSKNSVLKKRKVHRLVAEHFIANPENKAQVNHKKGIKKDNRASELEWVTNTENMRHAVRLGLRNVDHLIAYHKGRTRSQHASAKVVKQYDLNGNFIKSYPCVLDAIDETGVSQISSCARGVQKTAGGYKWSY